jgi:putative transposase
MKRSRFTEDQIFAILKEADGGDSVKEVCRRHGIAPATYYQWKAKYGGQVRGPDRAIKEERDSPRML